MNNKKEKVKYIKVVKEVPLRDTSKQKLSPESDLLVKANKFNINSPVNNQVHITKSFL